MTPTLFLQNEKGETLKQLEIEDRSYDELVEIFNEHGFTPKRKVVTYPEEPTASANFGGHHYEVFNVPNLFEKTLDFVQTKTHNGEAGYLLTITSPEENAFIADLLSKNNVDHVWIGAEDKEEGVWAWTQGPEKGVIFFNGRADDGKPVEGVFVNWREGEPNNADNNEDCGTLDTKSGAWNDAVCGTSKSAVVVEYGLNPLQIPKQEL